MCLFRDVTTHEPDARIWVKQGVRQGGVESPGLFVAVYDGIVHRISNELRQQEVTAIKVQFDPSLKKIRSNDGLKEDECEELDASQLKFLDDLLTFAEIEEHDDASIILEVLQGESTVKQEVCASTPGRRRCCPRPRELGARKRLKDIRAQSTGI
eukprot:4428979-Pyramimonas_sp.AAC.1